MLIPLMQLVYLFLENIIVSTDPVAIHDAFDNDGNLSDSSDRPRT